MEPSSTKFLKIYHLLYTLRDFAKNGSKYKTALFINSYKEIS